MSSFNISGSSLDEGVLYCGSSSCASPYGAGCVASGSFHPLYNSGGNYADTDGVDNDCDSATDSADSDCDTSPPSLSVVSVDDDYSTPYVAAHSDFHIIVGAGETLPSSVPCFYSTGDCSYSAMKNGNCEEGASSCSRDSDDDTQADCSLSGVVDGSYASHVSCVDMAGNGNSAGDNLDVSFSVSTCKDKGGSCSSNDDCCSDLVCTGDSGDKHCCGSNQYWDGSQCQTTSDCGTPCNPWSSSCTYYPNSFQACCSVTRAGGVSDEESETVLVCGVDSC